MKRFKRNKKHSLLSDTLIGILINALTLLAVALVFALIASLNKNPLGIIRLGGIISLYISAALASIIISAIQRDRNVIASFISALSFSLILLCIGLILSEGSFPLMSAVNYLVYCLIAFILARLCRALCGKRRRKI